MPTLDQMHGIYSESTRLFGAPSDINDISNSDRNNGSIDPIGDKHAAVGSGDRTSSSQAGEDTAQISPSHNHTTAGPFGIVPKNPFDSFNNDDDDSDDDDGKKGGGGLLYNGLPDLDIFEDSSKDESSQHPNSQRGRSKERKGGMSPSGDHDDDDDDDDAYLFDSVNSNDYDLSNHSERNQFVDLLSGNNKDSNGSSKNNDDDGGEGRSSIGNTNHARNGSDVDGGEVRGSIGDTNHAINGNKDDQGKTYTRSNVVENYGDNSSDDDSSANSTNLEKYATMQEILNDNSDRTNDMGRTFRKGFGGICCRANGCCDKMLGEEKTRRRKVSVALLAFVVVLFVVVMLVFFLVIARGKESVKESDMYSTEFEDVVVVASSNSPSWTPPSMINVTNGTDDSENFTLEFTIPTESPLGSDTAKGPGPPVPENDAGTTSMLPASSDPDITLLTDTIAVRLYFAQMNECTQANLDMESCLVSTTINDFITNGVIDNGMSRRGRYLQEDDCDTLSFNEEDEANFLDILNGANSKCNYNTVLPTTPVVGSNQQDLAAASTKFLQIFDSQVCWKDLCENGPNPRLEFDVSFDEAAKCADNSSSGSRIESCIIDVVFEMMLIDDGTKQDSDNSDASGQVGENGAPRRMQGACEHPTYDDYHTSLTSSVMPSARANCAEYGVSLTMEELDDAMSSIANVFAAEQCWLNSVGGCDDDNNDTEDDVDNTDNINLLGSTYSEPPSYYPTLDAPTYAPSSTMTSVTSYYPTQEKIPTFSPTTPFSSTIDFESTTEATQAGTISTPIVSLSIMPTPPSVVVPFNTIDSSNVTMYGNNNNNNNDTSTFMSTTSTIMPNFSSDSNGTTIILPVSYSTMNSTSTGSSSMPTLEGEPSLASTEVMEETTTGQKVILSGVSTVPDENSWEETTEKFYEEYYNVSGLLIDANLEILIVSVTTLNVRRSLLRRRRRRLKSGSSNPDNRELQSTDVSSVEVAYTQIIRYRSKDPYLTIEEIVQMPLGTEILRDEYVGELKALYGYEQLAQVSEIATVSIPALSSTPAELYHDESWDELPANIQGAYVTLGYNETMWNNKTNVPVSKDMDWDELSPEMLTAALEIGYTKELWDNAKDFGGNITNASNNFSLLDSASSLIPVSSPISSSMPSSTSLPPFQLSINSMTSASSVPTSSVAPNSSTFTSRPSDAVAVNSSGVDFLGTTNETVSVPTNVTSNGSDVSFYTTTSSFMPSSSTETLGTGSNGTVVNNVSNDTIYGTASSPVSEGTNASNSSQTESTSSKTSSIPTYSPTTSEGLDDNQPRMNAPPFVSSTPVSLDILSVPYVMHVDRKSPLMSSLSRYGSSVAISSDGNLVAVGATEATNEARGTTGAVYLYSLEKTAENASPNSLSLLQVLYGQSPMAEFGNAVSLSQDGNRLVVGSRSENDQTGSTWIYQRDASSAAEEEFTVVEGATFTSSTIADGATTITSSESNLMWSLMEGGVISGQNARVRAGWSVSISADGNVIAMGSPAGGNNKGGSILTFKYNDLSSEWEPYGSMIEGLISGQEAGYSISLSGTGSTMIVGSPKAKNLDGTINAGKSAVYFMNGPEWQLMGQEVYGEAESYIDGTSVAMSQDGSVVVVGGKGRNKVNATTGEVILRSTGHCHIYQFQYDQWEFQHSIDGKGYDEQLGFSVAVSSDGNVVACGGISGVKGNLKSGVVRLWNRANSQESTIWPRGEVADVEGATFGTSVAMSGDGEYVIVGAPTWTGKNGGGNSEGAIQIFRAAI